jgi:hypothetical protein
MPNKNLVKLICICFFVGAIIAAIAISSRGLKEAQAYAEGPPAGRTGAPGELTCGTSECHNNTPNSGPGQFSIIAPDSYEPGKIYQITVRHVTSDPSRMRWGFQLTVLDQANNKAGNLQKINDFTSILDNDGPGFSRQYIEHTRSGTFAGTTGGGSWTFNWIAPAENVGSVVFYAAGNQANNDGNSTGDQIYTARKVVFSGPPVIKDAKAGRKDLTVLGDNFSDGAVVLIDGREQPTLNDEEQPNTILIAKKVIKKGRIQPGQTVTLQVRNSDGTLSEGFSYTRPVN